MAHFVNKEFQKLCKQKGIDNQDFINAITFDIYLSIALNTFYVDITKTEENFEKLDSDYNGAECSYKGENISFGDYIKQKYGEKYYNFLLDLSTGKFKVRT
jgi:hypothetical protein